MLLSMTPAKILSKAIKVGHFGIVIEVSVTAYPSKCATV